MRRPKLTSQSDESRRTVRFSFFLLTVALSPIFLQTSTISCKSGDTTLSELAVNLDGQDIVDGFDPDVRSYSAAARPGTHEALVHALSTDPNAQVWIDLVTDGQRERYLHGGLGGGDMVVLLPSGSSAIEVWVRAPKGASGFYSISVDVALEFPCTEQGILDAIALGGGPHTFDCDGPTVVQTQDEIMIDNDVILDGEGSLILDGALNHRLLQVEANVTAELRGMTLTNGVSVVGAIYIYPSGSLVLRNAVVSGNASSHAGGVYNGGTLAVVDSIISDNSAEYSGGGVTNAVAGVLTVMDSTIANNAAQQSGGGILNAGSLVLTRSTIALNSAGEEGGGILNNGGDAKITNSTVSGNSASGLGGGIRNSIDGQLELKSSTLSENAASSGGAIHNYDGFVDGLMMMTNTLVEGACAGYPATPAGGGNLESPGDTCGFTDPSDQVNVSAGALNLGPLQNNGGPTETHALLAGSIAIDQIPPSACVDQDGVPLTTDQRGTARPQGAECDVGAFELEGGGANTCPGITKFIVSPIAIPIGETESLISVVASDPDMSPEPLRTRLSATTGTFDDPSASSTIYRCGAPGTAMITVRATDGDPACDVQHTASIECPSDIPVNVCPNLFTVNAIPSNIPAGEDSTDVERRADDADDGPLPLVTTFYAFRGTFDDPNAEHTVYHCETSGIQEICADASDGACVKTLCTEVRCP